MANRRKSTSNKTETYGKAQVSPTGVAMWSYLNKPAEAQDGMKEKYKISIFFDPTDPGFIKFEKLVAAANEKHGSTEDSCIKEADEYCVEYAWDKGVEGIALGTPYVSFNTSKGPIPVVDAAGAPTDEDIWSGDRARVQYNLCGWYFGKRKGVSCWLSGAQLIKTNREGLLTTSALDSVGEDTFDVDSSSLEDLLE